MKRQLIAVGLLCCLFYGCAPNQEPPVTDETIETTVLTTPSQTDDSLPPIRPPEFPGIAQGGIGQVNSQYDYKQGNTTILQVSMTLPVASIEGNETLQNNLNSSLSAVESRLKNEIDQIYRQYLRDYQAGRTGLTVPSVQVRFDLHYFTSEAVSMTYIVSETTWDGLVYTHSYHSNLDLRVGSEIQLSALLKDDRADMLGQLFVERLKESAPEGLYSNADAILADELVSSWYIAPGCLSIYLEAGKIAPLSSGSVVLTFSEDELSDLLSEYGKALL